MARRVALLIGNSVYQDAAFPALETPEKDVNRLAEVLRDPAIGVFNDVQLLLNATSAEVRRAIGRLFAGKSPDDLLILYFSGHGVLDPDDAHLYLACSDAEHDLIRATAVPAPEISNEMDKSYSQRIVWILDCCYSGAYHRGTKALPGQTVDIEGLTGRGRGRAVLTASSATQFAWEANQVIPDVENSLFTHFLVKGLETGEADLGNDGQITVEELYQYVTEQVAQVNPKQTPVKSLNEQGGPLIIAKSKPRVVPVKPEPIPPAIFRLVHESLPSARKAAVEELGALFDGNHREYEQAAMVELIKLTEDDSLSVRSAASETIQRINDQKTSETLNDLLVRGDQAAAAGALAAALDYYSKAAEQARIAGSAFDAFSQQAEEKMAVVRERQREAGREAQVAELLARANKLYRESKFTEALAALDTLLKLDPNHADALRLREQTSVAIQADKKKQSEQEERERKGEEQAQREREEKARREAQVSKLMDSARRSADAKKYQDALRSLTALLAIDPTNQQAIALQATVEKAKLEEDKRKEGPAPGPTGRNRNLLIGLVAAGAIGLLACFALLPQMLGSRLRTLPTNEPTIFAQAPTAASERTEVPDSGVLFKPQELFAILPHNRHDGEIVKTCSGSLPADVRISATFKNPYGASQGDWDYGFMFRDDADNTYEAVILTSDKTWFQDVRTGSVASGRLLNHGDYEGIDVGVDGENTVKVIAQGDHGQLLINGASVAELDLSDVVGGGQVCAVTGYDVGNETDGAETVIFDFLVEEP